MERTARLLANLAGGRSPSASRTSPRSATACPRRSTRSAVRPAPTRSCPAGAASTSPKRWPAISAPRSRSTTPPTWPRSANCATARSAAYEHGCYLEEVLVRRGRGDRDRRQGLQRLGRYGGRIGHVTLDEYGPVCRCGNRGCLETSSPPRAVLPAPSHGPHRLKGIVRALAGDPGCRRVIADAGRHIGVESPISESVEPEPRGLGGDLAEAGELVLGPIRESVGRYAIPSAARQLQCCQGRLVAVPRSSGPWPWPPQRDG